MRLILATQGTLGDHLPMAALAHGLCQQGLDVRLACNPAMHPLALQVGVQALPWGSPLGQSETIRAPLEWDHWQAAPQHRGWTEDDRRSLMAEIEELLDLLNPDDVLIGTRNLFLLSLVARVRQCRWLEVGLNSGAMIDFSKLATAKDSSHPWKKGLDHLERQLRDHLVQGADSCSDPPPQVRLHAVPDAFAPVDLPQLNAIRTGFWCCQDLRWQGWTPPTGLEQFLLDSPSPLGLVFSSQPLADPIGVLRRHLEVAVRLERRLVLVRGWAFGVEAQAHHPELAALLQHPDLKVVESLPLSWLLPKLAAVFIHGGMGTLAQALQAGCPTVIEPYGHDQFLNARLALQHRLALAVHPHRFEPVQVAQVLQQLLRLPPLRLDAAAFTGLAVALHCVGEALAPCI